MGVYQKKHCNINFTSACGRFSQLKHVVVHVLAKYIFAQLNTSYIRGESIFFRPRKYMFLVTFLKTRLLQQLSLALTYCRFIERNYLFGLAERTRSVYFVWPFTISILKPSHCSQRITGTQCQSAILFPPLLEIHVCVKYIMFGSQICDLFSISYHANRKHLNPNLHFF